MAYGAPGVFIGALGQPTNTVQLPPCTAYAVPPGQWAAQIGPYSSFQEFDVVSATWRGVGPQAPGLQWINSDGTNWRVINGTGGVVGAIVTNAGSGYTSPPTVVVSGASGAKATAILGGAVSSTVTVTAGGSSYVYPPLVVFQSPNTSAGVGPAGPGFAATGHSVLTNGVVTSIVVDGPGAGYPFVPAVYLINDPRDTTGSGATAVATLTGSQTVTGIVFTDPGNAVTAVPSLTFTGGGGSSAAATAIMDWSITGVTLTNAGSGYLHSGVVLLTTTGGIVAGSSINPIWDNRIFVPRQAVIQTATDASGILQAGSIIVDAGRFQATPTLVIADGRIVGGPATTAAQIAPTMGGTTDWVRLYGAPL